LRQENVVRKQKEFSKKREIDMEWIAENIGTIIISLILLAVIAAVVRKLWKDKKQKKSSCGCSCGSCSSCGMCQPHKSK